MEGALDLTPCLRKNTTLFMLFSPIPVHLNAQAEPLGWGSIATALKKITDTLQNLLELKKFYFRLRVIRVKLEH